MSQSKKIRLGFQVVNTQTGVALSEVFKRREPAREIMKRYYRAEPTLTVGIRTIETYVAKDWKKGDPLP